MRPAGGTTELDDATYLDLTPHPWAGLPVVVRLEAIDALDQRGQSEPEELVLPAREFQHPVARAIIEQRRRLAGRPRSAVRSRRRSTRSPARPRPIRTTPRSILALNSAVRRLLEDAR